MARPLIPESRSDHASRCQTVSTSDHDQVPMRGADPDNQSIATPDFLHVDHIEKASRLPVF